MYFINGIFETLSKKDLRKLETNYAMDAQENEDDHDKHKPLPGRWENNWRVMKQIEKKKGITCTEISSNIDVSEGECNKRCKELRNMNWIEWIEPEKYADKREKPYGLTEDGVGYFLLMKNGGYIPKRRYQRGPQNPKDYLRKWLKTSNPPINRLKYLKKILTPIDWNPSFQENSPFLQVSRFSTFFTNENLNIGDSELTDNRKETLRKILTFSTNDRKIISTLDYFLGYEEFNRLFPVAQSSLRKQGKKLDGIIKNFKDDNYIQDLRSMISDPLIQSIQYKMVEFLLVADAGTLNDDFLSKHPDAITEFERIIGEININPPNANKHKEELFAFMNRWISKYGEPLKEIYRVIRTTLDMAGRINEIVEETFVELDIEISQMQEAGTRNMSVHHNTLIETIVDCMSDNPTVMKTHESIIIGDFKNTMTIFRIDMFEDDTKTLSTTEYKAINTFQALLFESKENDLFLQHLKGNPETFSSYEKCLKLIEIGKKCNSITRNVRFEKYHDHINEFQNPIFAKEINSQLKKVLLPYLLVEEEIINLGDIELNESNTLVNLTKKKIFHIYFECVFKFLRESHIGYTYSASNILMWLKSYMNFFKKDYGADFIEIYNDILDLREDLVSLHNDVESIIQRVNHGLPLEGQCDYCK